jgi:hypothetical protein
MIKPVKPLERHELNQFDVDAINGLIKKTCNEYAMQVTITRSLTGVMASYFDEGFGRKARTTTMFAIRKMMKGE